MIDASLFLSTSEPSFVIHGSQALWLTVAALIVQRLSELVHARRNGAAVARMGAIEYGGDHYRYIVILHVLWLIAWPVEALARGPVELSIAALALAIGLQGLRYWSIASLGVYWNTRILVVPGHAPIRRGPYRWLRHPNYLVVVLELALFPAMFGAWWTALAFGAANLALLLGIRIPVEQAALEGRLAAGPTSPNGGSPD